MKSSMKNPPAKDSDAYLAKVPAEARASGFSHFGSLLAKLLKVRESPSRGENQVGIVA